MPVRRPVEWLIIAMLSLLLLAACGGSDEPEAATPAAEGAAEPEAAAETAPESEPAAAEPAASGAVDSLEGVRSAVVRIVASGTFVDPEQGLQLNAAGSGSGFIIDPAGIAVTNNHVVTGAAFLEVHVEGEDQPRNARVLGVSECSDLAVIDIDGEGFPYLAWRDGPATVGLDVYTAGFPLGDPEFTMTRGIISKERADGESVWASVDSVVEHDATINPGNSGGPLVTADGKVVAVNYAGADGTNQYFAIARSEAEPVLAQLRAEQDVTSIGVNGTAVNDGDSLYGVWVASVDTGSPADGAGIKPGDIITSLEGLILATDGSMADYCDILRSRRADDTMSIEVYRPATDEILEGQLNGDPLVASFSFAQTVGDEVPDSAAGVAAESYTDYRAVTDDSGRLNVSVPVQWTDVDGGAWVIDGNEIGLAVSASPDLQAYLDTWTMPGMFFGSSEELVNNYTEPELLDEFDFSGSCTYDGREDYEDALYSGVYDVWADCGGEGTVFVTLSATPESRNFMIYVEVQVVSDADLEALDEILASFVVEE